MYFSTMITQIPYLNQLDPILLTALIVLTIMGLVYLAIKTFEFSGFTPSESFLLIISPILGQILPLSLENLIIFQSGDLFLGINLFGFFVPVIISLKIFLKNRISKIKAITSTAIISIVTYQLSYFQPNAGIYVTNFYFVPIAASMISILFYSKNLKKVAPLAYVSGSIGVLLGADLYRTPQIINYSYTEPIGMIIGGAGILDAIFLVGIISIIIDTIIIFLNPECRREFKKSFS